MFKKSFGLHNLKKSFGALISNRNRFLRMFKNIRKCVYNQHLLELIIPTIF